MAGTLGKEILLQQETKLCVRNSRLYSAEICLLVSHLLGALSPANHRGLDQGCMFTRTVFFQRRKHLASLFLVCLLSLPATQQ